MTATLPGTSGGGSALAGIYDITASPYNATTGATDNTTAIQAAITAAKTAGGTVYVPPGVFKYASPLTCDLPSKGFSIVGASSGAGENATVPSELRYTGSGSTTPFSCHSVYGFGLVGIRFTYDNAAGNFTGDLVDIDGGPHAADCTNWLIEKCAFRHINSITARSMIRLNQAINGVIRDNGLAGATNCIRVGDPGGSYVVGVQIDNNTFNNSNDAHIVFGTADGENIVVSFNRFEASNNTTAIRGTTVPVDGAENAQYNLIIDNNWFGDAGAPLKWIDNLKAQSNAYTCIIRGNRFASSGGTTGIHCKVTGKWLFEGNSFEGGIAISSDNPTQCNFTSIANYYNCLHVMPTTWNFAGAGEPGSFVSLHDSGPAYDTDVKIDQLRPQVGIRGNAATFTTGNEDLVLASQVNSGYTTIANNKAAIYFGKPPATSRPMLALQAPDDGTDGNIVLLAGATPAEVVRIQRAKIGFYAATPVAQASRAGQLTDSTGGTVTSTLAAGITDAVAKNAIASLAAKVNALETIIHNLGLSA